VVEPAHRVHPAARDRAGVADEVQQQHGFSAEVGKPHPCPVRCGQVEVRRVAPDRQAGTESLRCHVPHPEVAEVEAPAGSKR
jgi:hypothetical protein